MKMMTTKDYIKVELRSIYFPTCFFPFFWKRLWMTLDWALKSFWNESGDTVALSKCGSNRECARFVEKDDLRSICVRCRRKKEWDWAFLRASTCFVDPRDLVRTPVIWESYILCFTARKWRWREFQVQVLKKQEVVHSLVEVAVNSAVVGIEGIPGLWVWLCSQRCCGQDVGDSRTRDWYSMLCVVGDRW